MASGYSIYGVVPLNAIAFEAAGAATFTFSVAFIGTVFVHVGLNVTLIMQLAPTARLLPQLLFWMNCPGFVPPSEMLLIARVFPVVLLTVTFFAALCTFSDEWNTASEAGDSV